MIRSTVFLSIIFFSIQPVEGQIVDQIRFVYHGEPPFGKDYPPIPHGTFALCTGNLVYPKDLGMVDSSLGRAIITDIKTYSWVREYILSSFYTYTAKDAEKAKNAGKPICPSGPVLEIMDSGGMDLFICKDNWRAFFDTLRSEMLLQSMDKKVIEAFKSPPYWPKTRESITEKKLTLDEQLPQREIIWFTPFGNGNFKWPGKKSFGIAKLIKPGDKFPNSEIGSGMLTDKITFDYIVAYIMFSPFVITADSLQGLIVHETKWDYFMINCPTGIYSIKGQNWPLFLADLKKQMKQKAYDTDVIDTVSSW